MKLNLDSIEIRPISKNDNEELAKVIRDTLKEFGANRPGTVYFDPTTDNLFELFQKPKSFYQVAVYNGQITGGGGIFPSDGLPEDTCELVKMYLLPEFRGIGLGSRLIQDCLNM
ncbi:MAG: GNAT family N-acetyltransferase, partial [Sphingobacteriales bacterium]